MRFLTIVSILLSLTGQPCLAAENNYFLEFGLHEGGDEIPTQEMAPQHFNRVEAGGFISISMGSIFWLSRNFMFSPGFGIVYSSTKLDFLSSILFGETSWRVYVLNLPVLLRVSNWQFGAGLTYHYKPLLVAQSDDYSQEWEFNNSIGTILKTDYYYNDTDTLGFQYTKIDYTHPETRNINGDNIAFLWRIRF